ncbi:hypothetical protein TNIN_472871 [Trichonephila inaurata madagascariensis]|uniref:Uncharacterized protein n=1 Tax=Trichonephila inaurata madagascariensis TaxID=2747483 RepID=A0A8X6YCG4_9ARAC|nr:hypothetical protein TNIN_472871 [Trichonephila inaurata madagascariensis]
MAQGTVIRITDELFLSLLNKLEYFVEPLENYEEGGLHHTDLILRLREAVWVHRKISQVLWFPFLRRHADVITSSESKYITYTNFILYNSVNYLLDPYDRLIATCSIIIAVAELSYERGKQVFSDCSSKIFQVFFEEFLKTPFEKRGGWQYLEEYILKQRYLKWYNKKEICPNFYKTEEHLQQELKLAEYIHQMACNDFKVDFLPIKSNENEVENNEEISRLTDKVVKGLLLDP